MEDWESSFGGSVGGKRADRIRGGYAPRTQGRVGCPVKKDGTESKPA